MKGPSTGLIIGVLLVSAMAGLMQTTTTHASTGYSNIIVNPGFENGVDPSTKVPLGWTFSPSEGVKNSSVTLDSTIKESGSYSAKVFVGPIVCSTPCPTRPIGFAQFYQSLPQGLNFANLSQTSGGLSFWWYYQPYPQNVSGNFRVRVISAEGLAELDYVFDPYSGVSYQNQTGSKYIFLYGFAAGEWHHFSVNVRSDWEKVGFDLYDSFSRLQFEGLAFQPPLKSLTFWLDDVQVLAGPIPPGTYPPHATFNSQPTSPYAGQSVLFRAIASDPNPGGSVVEYTWNFGDGSQKVSGNSTYVYHAFNQSGIYTAVLTVVDNFGISNAASKGVIVASKPACPQCPVARLLISPDDSVVGQTVNFDASKSSDPRNENLNFLLNFGDGKTSTSSTVGHAYSSPGVYFAKLTVTDTDGLTGTNVTTVTVARFGVSLLSLKVATPLEVTGQATTQNFTISLLNTGNLPLYAYVSFKIFGSMSASPTVVTSEVQPIYVRAQTSLSASFTLPSQSGGRYLVYAQVYVDATKETVGSASWTLSQQGVLVFRVI